MFKRLNYHLIVLFTINMCLLVLYSNYLLLLLYLLTSRSLAEWIHAGSFLLSLECFWENRNEAYIYRKSTNWRKNGWAFDVQLSIRSSQCSNKQHVLSILFSLETVKVIQFLLRLLFLFYHLKMFIFIQ